MKLVLMVFGGMLRAKEARARTSKNLALPPASESEADEDEDEEDELDEEDIEETPMPNRIRQYSNQPGEVSAMNPSITEDEDEDAEEVDDLL